MKVAQFQSLDCGYKTVAGKELDGSDHYVRISEYVDVEFPQLSGDEHIQGAVATLDRRKAKVTEEFGRKLADIERQKSELLAITHQPIEA